MRKLGPHGLTPEQANTLARERGLNLRRDIPNVDGYEFWGYGADGWLYKCKVQKVTKENDGVYGTYKLTGEADYNTIIGWKAKPNAPDYIEPQCQMPYCYAKAEEDSNICADCRASA